MRPVNAIRGMNVSVSPLLVRSRRVINSNSTAGDRRRVCRYSPVLRDLLLGWRDDSSFVQLPAYFVDLSMGGCLVEMKRRPPLKTGQAVWIQLENASLPQWIEGRVVAVRKPFLSRCKVSISFLGSFDFETFKSIVYGPDHVRDVSRPGAPDHEREGFWK
jgi:hypothetical protein